MALLTPEYLATKTYTAQRDRALDAALGVQAGVLAAGDFKATQRAAGANMSVDIAAGDAWVAGTDTARQGLYHAANDALVNAALDTTGAAWAAGHATLPRIDQVILRAFDTADGSAGNGNNTADNVQLLVLLGTATSGATLDNRTGAAALPSSCIRLADVLVPAAATTVTTANIRDRRQWARGASWSFFKTNGGVASAATFTSVDATNMKPRLECSGVPLEITFSFNTATGVTQRYIEGECLMDAATVVAYGGFAVAASSTAQIIARSTYVPAAGSHVFDFLQQSGTADTTVNASVGRPMIASIREIVAQSTNNS